MNHLDLILTLSAGLAVALVLGFAMHKVGLSPVVGYLLAGVVVGPQTPGFVANEQLASELAEIGVILLMFGVGLQFHLRELLAVRRIAIPGAFAQIAVATGLGACAARAWGWTWSAGVVFGIAISVASTVVLVRVLSDQRQLHTTTGRTALGWLVLEDLFTVFVLVVLPLLAVPADERGSSLLFSLGLACLKLAGFIAAIWFVGRHVIPHLFRYVAETRSRELFTLTVLVTALGIAVGAAKFFGASMALGAFLAGMIVGQSEFGARAASDALPMRDAFAVLFFVSVGMLFDPSHLLRAPLEIGLTVAIILIGKPLTAWGIMRSLGAAPRAAAGVAASLGQIGEFSFLLAASGHALGILPADAATTLVAASILTIAINPILYRLLDWMATAERGRARPASTEDQAPEPTEDLAVVVGYGPTGQMLVHILRENGIEPAVVDLNLEAIHEVRARSMVGVYGDATRLEVLLEVGLGRAAALFLTAASLEGTAEAIRVARQLNPTVKIYARTDYLRNVAALDRAGAGRVIAAEGEVALEMATALLKDLGASPDQIDRERDRMHGELRKRVGSGAFGTEVGG